MNICFWISVIITCVLLLILITLFTEMNSKHTVGESERQVKLREYRTNKAIALSFFAMLLLTVVSTIVYILNIKQEFWCSVIGLILVLIIFTVLIICMIIRQRLKNKSDENGIDKLYKFVVIFICAIVLVLDVLTFVLSRYA